MTNRNLLACGFSSLLCPLALHYVGPLVILALCPAIVAFTLIQKRRDLALLSFFTGAFTAFLVQHTLWVVSLPGIAVLSLYQGLIWIPMAFAVRSTTYRFRIPLTLAWPLIWCAGEVLRSLGPLGTLYGTLAMPKTTTLWMLQIADIGGASIAAFPLAAFQGWFADLYLMWKQKGHKSSHLHIRIWQRPFYTGTRVLILLWVIVGVYGNKRLSQVKRQMKQGPQVGVVATDVLNLSNGEAAYDPALLLEKLQSLSEDLVRDAPQTELIVWPEGMLGNTIPNRAFLDASYEPRMAKVIAEKTELSITNPSLETRWDQLRASLSGSEQQFQSWVQSLGVPVVVGMDAWIPAPVEHAEPFLLQNTAVHFSPHTGQDPRIQSKIRLYPLGEYLPLKDSMFAPIVRFILGDSRADYHPGTKRFCYSIGTSGVRYKIALCSELKFDNMRGEDDLSANDTKPYVMLVNLANEGLFQRNGMPEVFAHCATLRAIENRVTVVRSSNAGISGFWDPTGSPYGLVTHVNGQTQSGLGPAELEHVEKVIQFRTQHGSELHANPLLSEELTGLIHNVERIRTRAAVEGYASQNVYWLPERTVFQTQGDRIKCFLVGMLILMNAMEWFNLVRLVSSGSAQ